VTEEDRHAVKAEIAAMKWAARCKRNQTVFAGWREVSSSYYLVNTVHCEAAVTTACIVIAQEAVLRATSACLACVYIPSCIYL
jgi:hypothetical protein